MDDQEKEDLKNIKHQMREEKHIMFHGDNWLRHNAMVPKGFLRYHVLEALNQKAMSGSELMDEIQKHTGGNWKPSPGSIYPLLAWLQDNAIRKRATHRKRIQTLRINPKRQRIPRRTNKNPRKIPRRHRLHDKSHSLTGSSATYPKKNQTKSVHP